MAVSGDLMAIGAPGDDACSQDEKNNDCAVVEPWEGAGAVFIYRRTSGVWKKEAFLKASNVENRSDYFGWTLDLDGSTLAVGVWGEDSCSTDQGNNDCEDAGAVYVFAHDGTNWEQQAYLKAKVPDAGDQFGHRVSLSATC